jgi:hypothetical protein
MKAKGRAPIPNDGGNSNWKHDCRGRGADCDRSRARDRNGSCCGRFENLCVKCLS